MSICNQSKRAIVSNWRNEIEVQVAFAEDVRNSRCNSQTSCMDRGKMEVFHKIVTCIFYISNVCHS